MPQNNDQEQRSVLTEWLSGRKGVAFRFFYYINLLAIGQLHVAIQTSYISKTVETASWKLNNFSSKLLIASPTLL